MSRAGRCPNCDRRCELSETTGLWGCPRCGPVAAPPPRKGRAERRAARGADDAEAELAAWEGMRRALLPAVIGAVLGFVATVATLAAAGGDGKPWDRPADVVAFWVVFVRFLPSIFAAACCLVVPEPGPRGLAGVCLALGLAALGFHIASLRVEWADLAGRVAEALHVGAFLVFMVVASAHFRRARGDAPLKTSVLVVTLVLLLLSTGAEVLALTDIDRRARRVEEMRAEKAARTGRNDPDLKVDVQAEKQTAALSFACCNPFKLMMFVGYLFLVRGFADRLDNHIDELRREAGA